MKLSQVVGRYFDAWIGRDTWDSHRTEDDERFYRFVKAVARYTHRAPSQRDVQELILETWTSRRALSVNKTAEGFGALYQTLLNYERTRGFPDALIERTDIVRFHLALAVRTKSHEECNRIMTDAWGTAWRTDLKRSISDLRPGGFRGRPAK